MASEINLKLASIVNPTGDTFHHCLQALLDKHSPVSSKLMQVHKCSPWYNDISDLLQDAKKMANIWTDCAQRDLCSFQKDRY